ncbi:MDIS1-interacting receptor like kinase 1 [Cryptomeria japonica]|uniref:MDIS1-interacting receptor like kinase 1 n=1 Tax=Cryptomeria japonica TaxID=3369 RepID=UPI0027DA9CDD|nr:MDIS1-interacting receptor like kinase 1 [Cryptomeria japonica]
MRRKNGVLKVEEIDQIVWSLSEALNMVFSVAYSGLLTVVFLFFCACGTDLYEDGKVLLRLRSNLDDPLGHLHDWRPDVLERYCSWSGVSCNDEGRVSELDLSRMNLTGNVPEDIQMLRRLKSLKLASNGFTGPLPGSIANLTELIVLDISRNFFNGSFPSGLSKAKALVNISAYSNNFTGSLPEDIGMLSELVHLDFRGSFFDGTIPSSYGSLPKLKFLGLSGNNIGGYIPPELGKLSMLENLILAYNKFEGGIPAELGNLSRLEYLDLAFSNISGIIPPELGKLRKLHTLFFFKNRLSGTIPREIGNMSSLKSLDLSDNFLSGSLPYEIGKLKGLTLLSLMLNSFSGRIPESMCELPELETLEIWNNSFTGILPQELGRNSSLQWLDVSSNSFTGTLPPHLCGGGNLVRLIMFNNGFSGPIPKSLANCPSLWRVRMHNNQLSGAIPAGFGLLPNLTRLELARNRLNGSIPPDLSQASKLSFVDLSYNEIQDGLSSDMWKQMTILQSFYASNNKLVGRIPTDFGECPSLSVLDLSKNYLSGTIPSSLKMCNRLLRLDLRQNELSGLIPPELASLPVLAMLDLSENSLSGMISPAFGNSTALEIFNVSHNDLSGPLPREGIFKSLNPDALAGNPGLCGGVLPNPCFITDNMSGQSPNVPKKGPTSLVLIVGIIFAVSLAILLVGVHLFYRKFQDGVLCRNIRFKDNIYLSDEWPWRLTAFQRLSFTSTDILACIKESNIIGIGGTGTVYKAEMPSGEIVAVKKLWRSHEHAKDYKDPSFHAEADVLGTLRHRNIVRLLAYCYNNVNPMLIYEYMPNGSLAEALHGKEASQNNMLADWVTRYNIAVGIAQGLCYLHHDCFPLVVHRDVKSNNILLDSNLNARLADFGVAKLVENNEPMSTVTGSYGYIAPEYAYTLKVDEKSDIYSFGVVLMELLTGKRPIEPLEFGEGMNIVEWVRSKHGVKDGMEQALDPNVAGSSNSVKEEMILVLRIALLCTSSIPRDRPSMRDVVTMLGEAMPRRKSSGNTKDAHQFHHHECSLQIMQST